MIRRIVSHFIIITSNQESLDLDLFLGSGFPFKCAPGRVRSFCFVLPVKVSYGQTVEFGLKGGINSSNLYGDGFRGSHSVMADNRRMGLMAGGVTVLHVPKIPFYFQVELLYMQKGFRPITSVMGKIRSTWQLDYFEVPILAVFNITSHKLKPFIYSGVYFGHLLNATDQFPEADPRDISYSYNKNDFGMAFGAGVNIIKNIYLDARYSFSSINISPSKFVKKNRVMSFATGFRF